MKRIIVEGADGSGKSTLINMLQVPFPELVPVDGFKHSEFQDYAEWLKHVLKPQQYSGQPTIHNRLYYSEVIYGPLLRGRIALNQQQIANALPTIHQSMLIYCRPPYERLVMAATMNPQMEGVMDRLSDIYHTYDETMHEASVRHWIQGSYALWDFTHPSNYGLLLNQIREYLNR